MSDAVWSELTFEDLAADCRNAIVGGPFGSNLVSSDYTKSGVPVIRGQNMGDGRWVTGPFAFVSDEKAESLRANWARPGDIVFTQRGTIGQVALVPDGPWDRYVVSQSQMKATIDPDKADPLFIYYYFTNPPERDYIVANAIQTGVPHSNLGQLRAHPARIPPPREQRAIAGVLGALDDKIEQNRRTARALERLARAIFRAWFVDFEPVKAKAEGAASFPSMPQSVFDNLPARFVNSDIGLVPEGWEVKAVSAAFDVNPTRSLRKGALAPYLDMKNMPTQGHAPEFRFERPFGSGMRFVNGDTLVARITPCLENGKTAFVDFLDDRQVGWGSTEYIVLRPKSPLPPVFAYCLARTGEFRDFAIQNMTGTSGRQRVAPTAMDHFKRAIPPEAAAVCFGKIVQPLFSCIRAGMNESRKLAAMRDYLLPKLLSGSVRMEAING